MTLTVKYFGMLAEVTQCQEETFDNTKVTISEFLEALFLKYPGLREKDFRVAQHQKIAAKTEEITASELALLPPFAGG